MAFKDNRLNQDLIVDLFFPKEGELDHLFQNVVEKVEALSLIHI